MFYYKIFQTRHVKRFRSVLTKAELEALPVEGRIKSDVETRKVCFLCLKTRFGIFGPWGQRCAVCKKTVCAKCYKKVNLPLGHFAEMPVALLSPKMLATPEDDRSSDGSSRITPDVERDKGIACVSPGSPAARCGMEETSAARR